MRYYSASKNGFFSDTIHGRKMPPDAKPITEERYHALLAANSAGQRITADAVGNPIAVHDTEVTPRAARAWRNHELRRTDGLVLRHREETEMQLPTTLSLGEFAQLLLYRRQLREWPAQPGFPATGKPKNP